MAANIVYSTNIQGSVIMTGNTIQLCGGGSYPSIGIYTVGLPSFIPPNGGTTTTYNNNSTSAQITIPSTASVVKAYLTWGGYSRSYLGYNIPTAATLPVTFIDPSSIAHTVNPQNTQIVSAGGNIVYTQTVDVTTIVSNGGSGFYTVTPIPIVLDGNGASGGFILYIICEDYSEPFRNITIWSLNNGIQGGGWWNIH